MTDFFTTFLLESLIFGGLNRKKFWDTNIFPLKTLNTLSDIYQIKMISIENCKYHSLEYKEDDDAKLLTFKYNKKKLKYWLVKHRDDSCFYGFDYRIYTKKSKYAGKNK